MPHQPTYKALLSKLRKLELSETRLKKTEAALKASEARLSEAQKLAGLGYWHWDIETGEVHRSSEVYKIFGRDPAEFNPTIDSILAHRGILEENVNFLQKPFSIESLSAKVREILDQE